MSSIEEPSDNTNAWGIDYQNPGGGKKRSWGEEPQEITGPVARNEHAGDTQAPIPAVQWTAIVSDDELPSVKDGSDEENVELSPVDNDDESVDLFGVFEQTPDEEKFDVTPAVFQPPAEFINTGNDTDSEDDLAGMFGEINDNDLLPQIPQPQEVDHAGQENVELVAEKETTQPSEVAPTRAAAMDQWRQLNAKRAIAREQKQTPVLASSADDPLQYRFAAYDRLYDQVQDVLVLAKNGDPRFQGMLNNFILTRDNEIDRQQRHRYGQAVVALMQSRGEVIQNTRDLQIILDMAYDELIGLGPLGPLWRDDDITEIMVTGPSKVTVERNGELLVSPAKFKDLEHLMQICRDLSQRVDDRSVSRTNPLVTAQLPGARVQFVLNPVNPVAGASIVIRKFRPLFGIQDLLNFGALNDEMVVFLNDVVASRATILVSGGTGSGKTTMINALSEFIPDSERVITIEDALELKLSNTHVESLLTKEAASADDKIEVTQSDLLVASLRMRPDRIIIGEIRDGNGCAVMLQAANTGHDGTMTTVHANNPTLALDRLSVLLRRVDSMPKDLALAEVSSAFQVVVQVVRQRSRRFVSHISLVDLKHPGKTVTIFKGEYPMGSDAPTFAKVGYVGAETELGSRMLANGIDLSTWE